MHYIFLCLVIIFRTFTDLSFKKAVHHLHPTNGHPIRTVILRFLKNHWTWLGLLFGGGNFILWCIILAFFDLSYAYPFTAICYVSIIIAGKFMFHEHLDTNKLIGMGFIVLGVICLVIQ